MHLVTKVAADLLPEDAISRVYSDQGRYVDCFSVTVTADISFARFLEAFYTSRIFKLERFILACLVRKPSTDQQARQLAVGDISQFAAWTEEARTENQIIMCDYQQLTRSWLMTRRDEESTTLYFGTIIVPTARAETQGKQMGPLFSITLWAHLLYSKVLLRSAVAKLSRKPV